MTQLAVRLRTVKVTRYVTPLREGGSLPVRSHLATIPIICRDGPDAGSIGELPQRSRFHWLVSPRSTIIQTSPVHTGRTTDPAAALERLLDTMVKPPKQRGTGASHSPV